MAEVKIVRLDKVLAGANGNLEHVLVHNANGDQVATSNGVFVELGELVAGEKELAKATLASDATKEVLLVASPEVMYDERLYKLEDFVNKAGKASRAYYLFTGDIVTFTFGLIHGQEPEVGDKLIVKQDGLLGVAEEAELEGAKIIFEAIEITNELHHTADAVALRVTRA